MTKDAIAHLRQDLETDASALQAIDDVAEFARRIASLLARLEQGLAVLARSQEGEPKTLEEALYYRAVSDFAALQSQLAIVRSALVDQPLMLDVLRHSGHNVDSTRQHLMVVGAMDQALQHLIHLMQYDTQDRTEIDIRQGFQLSSGSMNYGRFYFAPPKENSGN